MFRRGRRPEILIIAAVQLQGAEIMPGPFLSARILAIGVGSNKNSI